MLAQHEAGMVLCLCSKNVEEDVAAVFEKNPGMRLRRESVIASRINWQAKSQNLRELAAELQLGLDSFIFVDDNPVECAEVEANCPEVLTLQLPEKAEEIPSFLRNVWAFDHWKITDEDRKRSAMYRENLGREQLRKNTGGLEEFLASLNLQIDIHAMQPDELARVAQLTERTNQFNCTTIRRTEGDIEKLCEDGRECLTVKVADRFGDYGLVGVVIFSSASDAIVVDTLLLSCRVLGRKVEHRIVARLGNIARERGLSRVDIAFVPTKKNKPALDFLQSVASQFREKDVYRIPAEQAAQVEKIAITEMGQVSEESVPVSAGVQPAHVRTLSRIAAWQGDVDSILRAIESRKRRRSYA
jgi:FkbH-like protein